MLELQGVKMQETFTCCRQLSLLAGGQRSPLNSLIDDAMPAYAQAQNPTALEFLSRFALLT